MSTEPGTSSGTSTDDTSSGSAAGPGIGAEAADQAIDRVLQGLDAIVPELQERYRDFHAHPELSMREQRTAAILASAMRDLGFEVHEGVGVTGVVAVLRNGKGPTVLMRADMDGLPVLEDTGLPYASTARQEDLHGTDSPVMHACGHDVHITALWGAAQLLAGAKDAWTGTFIALFQPGEEGADGAQQMVDDGLVTIIPRPDVALSQHVLPAPAGTVSAFAGPMLSSSSAARVTVHGRGGHGSMPHLTVDPAVLAAMIVVRLQAVVSRELKPGTFGVVTVGHLVVGSKVNIIADRALLEINLRAYDADTMATLKAAVERIVRAECAASGSPKDPDIDWVQSYPTTVNDESVSEVVADAFTRRFGSEHIDIGPQTASEDFSNIPNAFGTPYCYWGLGGADPVAYADALARDAVALEIPSNHSPFFAPVIDPTLTRGVEATVVAALSWLAKP